MAAERGWYGYTDDTGVTYNAFIGLGNQSGFSAYNAARGPRPLSLKMRYCTMQAASTGRKRRLLVGSVASGFWTGVNTTYTFYDENGAAVVYTVTGRVGERWRAIPHA